MKRTSLLFLFIVAIMHSQAQVAWNPQWPSGVPQKLEYSYIQRTTADTFASSDTAHTFIDLRYMGLSQGDYYFQWRFDGFYGRTVNVTGEGDKTRTYPIVAQTLARCPVVFKLAKSNFVLTVLNEPMLDSVANLVMDQMLAGMPEIQTKEDKEEWKQSAYRYSMYRDAFKPIRDYFWIYQVIEQKPNVKKEIQPYIINALSSDGPYSDSTTGYCVFQDTDPKVYKWKLEANLDLSKMMNGYTDMLSKIETIGVEDSIVRKAPKPPHINAAENVKADILINKPDMVVTSYSLSKSLETHIRGISSIMGSRTEIRLVK